MNLCQESRRGTGIEDSCKRAEGSRKCRSRREEERKGDFWRFARWRRVGHQSFDGTVNSPRALLDFDFLLNIFPPVTQSLIQPTRRLLGLPVPWNASACTRYVYSISTVLQMNDCTSARPGLVSIATYACPSAFRNQKQYLSYLRSPCRVTPQNNGQRPPRIFRAFLLRKDRAFLCQKHRANLF